MTGFTNFLPTSSLSSPWFLLPSNPFESSLLQNKYHYNKSESLFLPSDYLAFDYLLTTSPELHTEGSGSGFEILEVVEGFKGYRVRKSFKEGLWPIEVRMEKSVWILKRRELETGEEEEGI